MDEGKAILKVRMTWLLALGLLVSAMACQPNGKVTSVGGAIAASGPKKLHVVATVGMVADLVREVGGDRVAVDSLMGSGVDPHLYKATRDDVAKILGADLVFYSGLMLEGKLADTLDKIGKEKTVIPVTRDLSADKLIQPTGSHPDPHVWMDVGIWSQCAEVICRTLESADPSSANAYRSRLEILQSTLAKLDTYGRDIIQTIPESKRVLVTSHDAFHYLGRAYGLEVVGVQGISTDSEAGLQRINSLVDLLVQRKIESVFVESSVSPKNIEALCEGARARGHVVHIGGSLFSDAMGPAGTYEGTYIGMLDHNFTIIAQSLGGEARERGWQGRLEPMATLKESKDSSHAP